MARMPQPTRVAGRHAVIRPPAAARWGRAGAALVMVALAAGFVLAFSRPEAPAPAPAPVVMTAPTPAADGAAAKGAVAPAADRGVDALVDPTAPAAAVLRAWDAARARAYATGRRADLRALYAPGSRAARADLQVLRAYAARGLSVRDARMQLAEVTELHRGRDRLRVAVVERLGPAYAVGADGRRLDLPRDSWRSRHLVLRFDDRWRVVSARAG